METLSDCQGGQAVNFDQSFERLLKHEGGYVNHPSDPGGETKFGISKRAYPNVDIKALTEEEAKRIYRRDYWDPMRLDDLPQTVRFDMFDTAVNSGIRQAVIFLQRAAGVDDDGKLGPVTIAECGRIDPERLAARFNGHRLDFLNNLRTWPAFGRGWAQRIADNLMEV